MVDKRLLKKYRTLVKVLSVLPASRGYADNRPAWRRAHTIIKALGWRYRGSGSYALVYECGPHHVVRVSMSVSDRHRQYAEICMRPNPQPWMPKIYRYDKAGSIHVALMEKLEVSWRPGPEGVRDFLQPLLPPKTRFDLHSDNIATRPEDGSSVVIDPWAHSKYRNYAPY